MTLGDRIIGWIEQQIESLNEGLRPPAPPPPARAGLSPRTARRPPAPTAPAPAGMTPRPASQSPVSPSQQIRARLRGPGALRQAVILKEILDKPLALRRRPRQIP